MNVATAETVMKLCAERLKKAHWMELGRLIARRLSQQPEAKPEEIADAVVAQYGRDDG